MEEGEVGALEEVVEQQLHLLVQMVLKDSRDLPDCCDLFSWVKVVVEVEADLAEVQVVATLL